MTQPETCSIQNPQEQLQIFAIQRGCFDNRRWTAQRYLVHPSMPRTTHARRVPSRQRASYFLSRGLIGTHHLERRPAGLSRAQELNIVRTPGATHRANPCSRVMQGRKHETYADCGTCHAVVPDPPLSQGLSKHPRCPLCS